MKFFQISHDISIALYNTKNSFEFIPSINLTRIENSFIFTISWLTLNLEISFI